MGCDEAKDRGRHLRRACAPAAPAAPEGQLTWAMHISTAPIWFVPGEHNEAMVKGTLFRCSQYP